MTAPTNSVSSLDKINAEVFEDAPMTPIDQKTNETWKKSTPALAEGIRPTSSQVVFKDEKTIEELKEERDKLEAIALRLLSPLVVFKDGKTIEELKEERDKLEAIEMHLLSPQGAFKDGKTIEELKEERDKLEAIEKRLEALESAILKCKIEEIKKMLENALSNPYQIVSKYEKTIEEATKLLEEASVITGINKDKKIIEVKKDEAIGFFQNFGRQVLEGVKFTRDLSIIAVVGGTLLILFFPPAREKFCVVVGKILLKIVVPVIDLGIEKLESSVKAQLPGLTDAIQRGVEAGSPSCAIV